MNQFGEPTQLTLLVPKITTSNVSYSRMRTMTQDALHVNVVGPKRTLIEAMRKDMVYVCVREETTTLT